MDKNEIAEILRQVAVLLDLKGENRFKSLAYLNAARSLELLHEDLTVLIQEERLREIKGIGQALAEKITELHVTGRLAYYDELKASFPTGLLDCLRILGLGPKKVKVLWEKLGVTTVEELRQKCISGLVAGLDGFGEKTQAKILEGIANLDKYRGQFLYPEAFQVSVSILNALKNCPVVHGVEIAGSLRRKKEVTHDLDFVISTDQPEEVMKLFTSLPEVMKITNQGKTKSSVILNIGIQADARCVSAIEYPFALAYFTGSKEHNIAMRQRAIAQGKKLNEYGLFNIQRGKEDLISCKDEAAIYSDLGLDYVEPELREDMGEMMASEIRNLPKLISPKDIRGIFHNHTQWSDGRNTLEEMPRAAIAKGWKYLGISDHSKTSVVANGLDEKRLAKQMKEIDELNKRFEDEGVDFYLFKGSEVDILADGQLDFSNEVLGSLDFVVASIHQGFSADEAKQTARVLRAISNPYVTMLGHATGRLLLTREPYRLNLQAVIDAAAQNQTMIELNATPSRMELDWRWWKGAKEKGVLCSINPDAHSIREFEYVSLGVGIARKGWLMAQDVLNTYPITQVKQLLARKRIKK